MKVDRTLFKKLLERETIEPKEKSLNPFALLESINKQGQKFIEYCQKFLLRVQMRAKTAAKIFATGMKVNETQVKT